MATIPTETKMKKTHHIISWKDIPNCNNCQLSEKTFIKMLKRKSLMVIKVSREASKNEPE